MQWKKQLQEVLSFKKRSFRLLKQKNNKPLSWMFYFAALLKALREGLTVIIQAISETAMGRFAPCIAPSPLNWSYVTFWPHGKSNKCLHSHTKTLVCKWCYGQFMSWIIDFSFFFFLFLVFFFFLVVFLCSFFFFFSLIKSMVPY